MRIVFMGTPDFAVPILQRLINDKYEIAAVVTQPDRPKGRKKTLTPPPVKTAALRHGIPVLQPDDIREPERANDVFSYKPDLVITAAFGQMLPKAILSLPPLGCVNVHASLLPEYRGGAPIHHALIDGKKETGVTVMYMAEKMDAGDILAQSVVPIDDTDNVGTLHDKLSVAGARLLADVLPKLEAGSLTPVPQDEEKVTYAPNIRRDDERIDWHAGGEAIFNRIRGMNPWPGAYTLYKGRVMKIWQAEKVHHAHQATPGTVISIDRDGFLVRSGDDVAIRVTELQPAGKKRMTSAQFLQGADLKTGETLGEAHDTTNGA